MKSVKTLKKKQIISSCCSLSQFSCLAAFKGSSNVAQTELWNRMRDELHPSTDEGKSHSGRRTAERSPTRLKGPHVALLSPWLNCKQLFSSVFCRLYKCQSIKMTNGAFSLKMALYCHLGNKPACQPNPRQMTHEAVKKKKKSKRYTPGVHLSLEYLCFCC